MNFIQADNGETIIFGYSPVNEITFRDFPKWDLNFKIGVNSLFHGTSINGHVKITNYTDNRDMVIATAPNDILSSNADGPALSFENTNGTWTTNSNGLTGVRLFTNNNNSARYGRSVDASESGKYIIIGGPDADNFTGAALLYTRNENNWNLVQKISGVSNNAVAPIIPPFSSGGPRYGTSVSINKSGDVIMINGPYDESGAGGALIYTGTNWNTPAYKITGVNNSFMGFSADMNADGSVIILGGENLGAHTAGYTNIFTGNKNIGWKLAQTITGVNSERLGTKCSINDNGDVIALGSYSGYVALYTGNATNKWSLAQRVSGNLSWPYYSHVRDISLSQDASVIVFIKNEFYENNNISRIFIYTGNAQSKWSLDGEWISDLKNDDLDGDRGSVNDQGTTIAVYDRKETLAGYDGYTGAVNILKKI